MYFNSFVYELFNAVYSINGKAFHDITTSFTIKNAVIVRDITNSFYVFKLQGMYYKHFKAAHRKK